MGSAGQIKKKDYDCFSYYDLTGRKCDKLRYGEDICDEKKAVTMLDLEQ